MINYILCLRPLNLFLVYLTQVYVYHIFFTPIQGTLRYDWNLYPPNIQLFGLVTVLIAASGYLINDYFDFDSDRLNLKANKIPRFHNLYYYYILVALGLVLALWIADDIGKPLLTLIYLAAVALLYLYSASWKKKVLIGNVIVSSFSSFVILILLYAEKDHLLIQSEHFSARKIIPLLSFSVFAFLISMTREIIKDIEDLDGDRAAGYNTLPIAYGIPRARLMAAFYGIGLLFTLGLWTLKLLVQPPLWVYIYVVVFLFVPIGYLIIMLLSRSVLEAGLLSKLCKLIMIFGLILLIITGWTPFPIN